MESNENCFPHPAKITDVSSAADSDTRWLWDDSINQQLWQHVAPVICLGDGGGGFFFLESRTIWMSGPKNRLTVTEKSPVQSRSRPRIYSLQFRKLEESGCKARPRRGKLLDTHTEKKMTYLLYILYVSF